MPKPNRSLVALLAFTSVLAIAVQTRAAGRAADQTAARVPVTTTVTVLGPKFTAPPPLTRQDINAFSGKTKLDVLNWVPAQASRAPLQLAVVIDNAASQTNVATQLGQISSFVRQQPRSTAVGIFYAENGTVQVASNFTTDHEAAAKTLRMPIGLRAGASPSVYLSLSDLVKNKWPVSGARREVLLIASGVDQLDRGPQSPYVDAAIEDMQKSGVVVHAIYVDGVRFGETLRGQFAQDNLVQLAQGSGGYDLYEGITTPVSFAPYLQQLDMVLHNQYQLTVAMPGTDKKKGELKPLDIKLEQRNVELKYPKQVLVPGPK
jgi:hypothetical protein